MQATTVAVSLLVVAVVVGVPAVYGRTRRLAIAWWWCLVVRHRLRLYFADHAAGTATARRGSRPLILHARPTPAGERVWVWLRPGLSLKDLEADGQIARLAVTCWASEVRVIRASRSYAGLLRFDITRREPLAGTVISPLPVLVPQHIPTTSVSADPPPADLDLPDVPEDTDAPDAAPRRTRRTPPAGEPTPSRVDANYDYA